MKAYKLIATVLDNNKVRVTSTNHETLGDACGMIYLTRERADEAMTEAQEGIDSVCPDWQAKVEIEEVEIDGLVEGERYDAQSVAAVMTVAALPQGYNVYDYFGHRGVYLGDDDYGVGIRL